MVNEQRFVQLKMGVLVNIQDVNTQAMNLEEYNLTYLGERAAVDKLRDAGKDIDTFDVSDTSHFHHARQVGGGAPSLHIHLRLITILGAACGIASSGQLAFD